MPVIAHTARMFALVTVAWAAGTAAPAPALAGPGDAPSDAPSDVPSDVPSSGRARASVLVKEGGALYNAGKFERALAVFEQAHAAYPAPAILMNIGSALAELRRPADAANAYAAFLDHPDRSRDNDAEIARLLARLTRRLGSVVVRVPDGTGDVAITVDGEVTRRPAGVPVWVTPGSHDIRATRDGAVSEPRTVDVAAGARAEVALSLPAPTDGGGAGPQEDIERTPEAPGTSEAPGRMSRGAFWGSAAVAVVATVVAIHAGAQVGGAEDDKTAAILAIADPAVQAQFGPDEADVCARAEQVEADGGGAQVAGVLDACDRGLSAETRLQVATGIAAVAAVAAGALYWHGFVRARPGADRRAAVVPVVTRRSAGAALMLRF